MKKLQCILIVIICFLSTISIGGCDAYNFRGIDDFTFFPSYNDIGVWEFKRDFRNSEFYDDFDNIVEYNNVLPKSISNRFEISLIEVVDRRAIFRHTTIFIYYNGQIIKGMTYSKADGVDDEKGILHFAMTDINNDGYFELLFTVGCDRYGSVAMFDSKNNSYYYGDTFEAAFLYFKKDEKNNIAVYTSQEKNIKSANTLCARIETKKMKYKFAKNKITLKSQNYKVTATVYKNNVEDIIYLHPVDESIYFSYNYSKFYLKLETEWLGETFEKGALQVLEEILPSFVGKDKTINHPYSFWYVMKGSIIWKKGDNIIDEKWTGLEDNKVEYRFYHGSDVDYDGTYDLVFSFFGEEVVAKNFLTITTK